MTDHKGLTMRNGVWLAYWQFQGKRMYKSTGETDLQKAIKKREEIIKPYMLKDEQDTIDYFIGKRTRIEKTLEDIENKKPGVLLRDVWETYLNSDLRHFPINQVLNRYKCFTVRLINFLNDNYPNVIELRDITLEIAKDFCLSISNMSNSTYNQHTMFLKHLFNTLKKQAKLNENVWDYIPKKKAIIHSRRELTAEELKKVLDNAEGDMKTLFCIGIYTGLRVGDCATIKWENVDLDNDMISIIPRKTKNSSGKRVYMPIHADLKNLLVNLDKNDSYVIPKVAEMYLLNNSVKLSRHITKIFEKSGIKTNSEIEGNKNKAVDVGFHSLRHTFVSICANSGVPMTIVQALVGHSNPAMTEHYFHENTVVLKQAIKSLPKVGETKVDKTVVLDKFKTMCQEIADNGLLNEALEILKNTQPKVIEKETETDISLL